MAEFPLQLEAPSRDWAEHVRELMQQGLGEQGSVQIDIPEGMTPGESGPGYVLTGIAVCNEPADEMLALITSKLAGYDVELINLDGATQITVRP